MNTPVRDMYINVLEKRAMDVGPDYGTDNQAIANSEVSANVSDQRAQLSGLLSATKATEKATTKQVGQLLPIAKKTPGTSSSNPLLKVAVHKAFFSGVRQTGLLKTASPEYLRTAFRGFEDEINKMASWVTGGRGVGIVQLVKQANPFMAAMGVGKNITKKVLKGGAPKMKAPIPIKVQAAAGVGARPAASMTGRTQSINWGKFASSKYTNAVAKFAASFTPASAVQARLADESLPENSDPSQTAFRSTSR